MAQFDLIDDSEEMEQAGTVDVLIPLGLDQAYSYACLLYTSRCV